MLISFPLTTLQAAVVKYSAQFNAMNQISNMRILLSSLLKKALGLAIITFFLFYFLSFYIVDKLKVPSVACGYALAILIASSWITPILLGGIQGQELFRWFTLILVITAALKLTLSFIFIPLGFNITGALTALLFSSLIGIAVSLLPLKSNLLLKVKKQEDSAGADFKEIFIYILPVAISFFCFANLVNMDMVLVKYYFSPLDSGLYSLAQMVGKIFLFLPAAISIVMFPRTSGLSAKNMDTTSTLKKALLYATMLCITASLFYNLFPLFFLKILTGKIFFESIALGRLFSVSMIFFTLLFILINYFLSIKDLRFIRYLALFTFLQFFAIVFFHRSLFQVQLILCINSVLLFFIHLALVNKQRFISRETALFQNAKS